MAIIWTLDRDDARMDSTARFSDGARWREAAVGTITLTKHFAFIERLRFNNELAHFLAQLKRHGRRAKANVAAFLSIGILRTS
jgi:hypothetical protein